MHQFPPEPQEPDDEPLEDLDAADEDYEREEPIADDPETWVEFLPAADDTADEDALHGIKPRRTTGTAKASRTKQPASKKKKAAPQRKPAGKPKPAASAKLRRSPRRSRRERRRLFKSARQPQKRYARLSASPLARPSRLPKSRPHPNASRHHYQNQKHQEKSGRSN